MARSIVAQLSVTAFSFHSADRSGLRIPSIIILAAHQILSKSIMKLARDAASLFILRRDQARAKGGAARDSAIPVAGVLRCSSAKTLTLARKSSGTTGTEM